MNPAEPTLVKLSNPWLRYFLATRPAFLLATLLACLLGFSIAISAGGEFNYFTAVFTLLLALVIHAAVNVINDYFDALNGTDANNTQRIYPFTGGSRFIQNGVLTVQQVAYFAYALMLFAILGGLVMAWIAGWALLWIGVFGVLIGWAYSATPLRLNSRGLGEVCVFTSFLGVVLGADFVQSHGFSFRPVLLGIPYALLVTNLLYINQFPDRQADIAAGKLTLVARLPIGFATWLYWVPVVIALLSLLCLVKNNMLPLAAMWSALPLLFSLRTFAILRQYAAQPEKLSPAIKLTLASMIGHALLLAIVLLEGWI